MVAKNHTAGSKVVVGEIDTSLPFQSVKDAVNLFGEGAFSGEKSAIRKAKPYSAERALAKETQLHLAQKELNRLKEHLKNAETTKAEALVELERAKRTVDDLTNKHKIISESKELALKATEAAKSQANQLEQVSSGNYTGSNDSWKQDLETAREQYMAAMAELNVAKQELRKIHQDRDARVAEKISAIKRAAEAENAAKANLERGGELAKETTAVHESVGHVKLAIMQVQQEEAEIYAEKDVLKQSYNTTLEELTKKLLALKKEVDSQHVKNLENQLAEASVEIKSLQNEMDKTKTLDLDSVRTVTSELDNAKDSLHKVAEEENSLRSLVESLKLELVNVKNEHSELKEKEAETESVAGNLHVKLRKSQSELEAAITEESKVKGDCEEMISTLGQLLSESESGRHESEEMKKQAEELKKEAKAARIALEEAENTLRIAFEEAEEAKAAESRALDQIKILSERTNAARASTSESGAQITISREEFESLSRKVEESDKLAEVKVAAALAQVEAVKASENEVFRRLETIQKEVEDLKTAAQDALRKAEMAEAAKKAVEGELRRWHEREQKKAAEAASRILAEKEFSAESSPSSYGIQKQNPPDEVFGLRKLEKVKTSVSRKALLPNLSSIFHRKKNQLEGGFPSYLPGEKPI